MAKEKKSFILYTDIKSTVDKLSDEYAGRLLKHILSYVNDENPTTDDLLLEIAFEPIKQQFKRDLEKWEAIKEKRSEAGKLGGRPKKQTKANKANGFFEKQTKAKKAVSVNVNVNDNVSVNDNVINTKRKKDKKEIELFYPFDTSTFKAAVSIWKQYKADQHKFKYKSLTSEQALLKQLGKDYTTEIDAIEAIEYSMANGYKGIYKPQPKNNKNENSRQVSYSQEFKQQLYNELNES